MNDSVNNPQTGLEPAQDLQALAAHAEANMTHALHEGHLHLPAGATVTMETARSSSRPGIRTVVSDLPADFARPEILQSLSADTRTCWIYFQSRRETDLIRRLTTIAEIGPDCPFWVILRYASPLVGVSNIWERNVPCTEAAVKATANAMRAALQYARAQRAIDLPPEGRITAYATQFERSYINITITGMPQEWGLRKTDQGETVSTPEQLRVLEQVQDLLDEVNPAQVELRFHFEPVEQGPQSTH